MKVNKKYIKSIDPSKSFYSYWENNCEGKNTQKQLEILYDENFNWASWLLSNILDRTNRKNYAIYAATASLPIFETQYALDTRPNDAIQASNNNTITQLILDDAFDAYVMAATADFDANYTYSAYATYIASYGSFARIINKEISNFRNIANLTAISAANADNTKKQEIFDYGLGLI